MKWLIQFLVFVGLLSCFGVRAADPVTDAMSLAYAPYRSVLFRTNSRDQTESVQAMAQTQQAWKLLVDRFAGRAPIPYDSDPDFGMSLDAVTKVYEQASSEIGQGRLAQAHETLEKARDIMADLRRRNGVIVYSDHMNAYHTEMEHLLQQAEGLTGSPQGMLNLIKRVGVLGYLAERLRSEAPKALQNDAGFRSALQELEASVYMLHRAAMSQNAATARDALSRLKGPYSKMFLAFG